MKNIKVFYVDSFTDKQFQGNPAAVVLFADDLTSKEMKCIAAEINLSETAFVMKSNPDHFKMRYFTPTQEIDYCGHATLATAWLLGTKFHYAPNPLQLETNIGVIEIEWEMEAKQLNKVFMRQIVPQVKEFDESIDEVFTILGLNREDHDIAYPIKMVYTGNWDLLIYLKSKTIIDHIKPNMEQLKQHNLKYQVTSVHLFTFNHNQIYTRNFAPAVGIDEDPVTGSTNGALVGYLMLEKILSWENHQIDIIQTSTSREGSLVVKVEVSDNGFSILVGGKAIPILEGNIQIE